MPGFIFDGECFRKQCDDAPTDTVLSNMFVVSDKLGLMFCALEILGIGEEDMWEVHLERMIQYGKKYRDRAQLILQAEVLIRKAIAMALVELDDNSKLKEAIQQVYSRDGVANSIWREKVVEASQIEIERTKPDSKKTGPGPAADRPTGKSAGRNLRRREWLPRDLPPPPASWPRGPRGASMGSLRDQKTCGASARAPRSAFRRNSGTAMDHHDWPRYLPRLPHGRMSS